MYRKPGVLAKVPRWVTSRVVGEDRNLIAVPSLLSAARTAKISVFPADVAAGEQAVHGGRGFSMLGLGRW